MTYFKIIDCVIQDNVKEGSKMILEIEDPEKKIIVDIEYPHFKTKPVFLVHTLMPCTTFDVL